MNVTGTDTIDIEAKQINADKIIPPKSQKSTKTTIIKKPIIRVIRLVSLSILVDFIYKYSEEQDPEDPLSNAYNFIKSFLL